MADQLNSMTSEPRHREWWIYRSDDPGIADTVLLSEPRGTLYSDFIHVIEYSAFLAVKAELEHFKNEMLQYKYEYENVCNIAQAAEVELERLKAIVDELHHVRQK